MSTRNLFNSDHGPGKGDKPRSKFDRNWQERFSEIGGMDPGNRTGFVRSKRGWVKTYSKK